MNVYRFCCFGTDDLVVTLGEKPDSPNLGKDPTPLSTLTFSYSYFLESLRKSGG